MISLETSWLTAGAGMHAAIRFAVRVPRRAALWALLLGVSLSFGRAAGAADAPKFADYPAAAIYHGRNAAPILATKEAREFRARIRDGAREKPNFDGHYIVVGWGCGADCAMGAIIDAISGTVVSLPYVAGTLQQNTDNNPLFDYRIDSRLIVLNGMIREEPPAGSHYFEFDGKALRPVTTIVRPEWSPDAPGENKPQ
ncbi:MAG TPA: hypothetical protein VM782_10575 [Stellaceae bacterium]|nr:hypothetical protein [Stellaceae bacterium]